MTGWSPRLWEDTSAQRCFCDTLLCNDLCCCTCKVHTVCHSSAEDHC